MMLTKTQILQASKQLHWAEEMGSLTEVGGNVPVFIKTAKECLPLQIPDVSPETFTKRKKTAGRLGGSFG